MYNLGMSYQDILWSRPTRRTGRILLVGGHRDGFAALQRTYAGFEAAGAAESHLALPDKLSKHVGNLEGISLVASNPSGSIARDATAELVHLANQSDAVCIGPDLSNNSETTLTMQRVITETRAAVIIPSQSTEQLIGELPNWSENANTLVFLNQKQLLKLAAKLAADATIPLNITNEALQAVAQATSAIFKPSIVIQTKDAIIYAVDGEAGIAKIFLEDSHSGALTGLLGLFWLQNGSNHLDALEAALYITQKAIQYDNFEVGIKQELAQV
jgi:NAD(P)H-hydrate epimerase